MSQILTLPMVSDSEIKLGQSIPFSGPASAFSPVGRVHLLALKKRLGAKAAGMIVAERATSWPIRRSIRR